MKILKRKKKKRTIKNRFVLTVVSSPVEIFLPLHLNLISDYNIYIYVSLFFFFKTVLFTVQNWMQVLWVLVVIVILIGFVGYWPPKTACTFS